jgi:hypothetical protein
MTIFGGRKLILMDEEVKQQPPIEMRIEKGDLVKDKITGFQGVVVCVLDYLHGCFRLAVQSLELKDGLPKDHQYFDSHQLEIVEKGFYFKEPVKIAERKPGGEQEFHDNRSIAEQRIHQSR